MVGAAVAERQLEGLEADRAAQQLVAEADAEHRHLPDQLAHVADDVVERGRVARARWRGTRRPARAPAPRRARWCTAAARAGTRARRRLRTIERLDAGVERHHARARRPSPTTIGSAGVTSRARSRPEHRRLGVDQRRAPRARACSPGKTPPRIAPAVADVAHERRACPRRRSPATPLGAQPVEPASVGARRARRSPARA